MGNVQDIVDHAKNDMMLLEDITSLLQVDYLSYNIMDGCY